MLAGVKIVFRIEAGRSAISTRCLRSIRSCSSRARCSSTAWRGGCSPGCRSRSSCLRGRVRLREPDAVHPRHARGLRGRHHRRPGVRAPGPAVRVQCGVARRRPPAAARAARRGRVLLGAGARVPSERGPRGARALPAGAVRRAVSRARGLVAAPPQRLLARWPCHAGRPGAARLQQGALRVLVRVRPPLSAEHDAPGVVAVVHPFNLYSYLLRPLATSAGSRSCRRPTTSACAGSRAGSRCRAVTRRRSRLLVW